MVLKSWICQRFSGQESPSRVLMPFARDSLLSKQHWGTPPKPKGKRPSLTGKQLQRGGACDRVGKGRKHGEIAVKAIIQFRRAVFCLCARITPQFAQVTEVIIPGHPRKNQEADRRVHAISLLKRDIVVKRDAASIS